MGSALAREFAELTGEDRDSLLTREDWLAAALELLIAEGVEAIRITRLAKRLEVTRGSFYWHFADRDDLLSGCIAFWQRRNSEAVEAALRDQEDLADGVFALFAAWMVPGRFDHKLDMAMRDWAKRSETVRSLLEEEDSRRLAVIADFFERCGISAAEAKIRAQIIYYGQLGYFLMGVELPLTERLANFPLYFQSFTGRIISEADCEPYRREIAALIEESRA